MSTKQRFRMVEHYLNDARLMRRELAHRVRESETRETAIEARLAVLEAWMALPWWRRLFARLGGGR